MLEEQLPVLQCYPFVLQHDVLRGDEVEPAFLAPSHCVLS